MDAVRRNPPRNTRTSSALAAAAAAAEARAHATTLPVATDSDDDDVQITGVRIRRSAHPVGDITGTWSREVTGDETCQVALDIMAPSEDTAAIALFQAFVAHYRDGDGTRAQGLPEATAIEVFDFEKLISGRQQWTM